MEISPQRRKDAKVFDFFSALRPLCLGGSGFDAIISVNALQGDHPGIED
jgi:hypothetical protein